MPGKNVGNSGPNGMAESPFPPAGEPIPDEAEAVVRDTIRPQDQLRGERHPPQQIPTRGCGLLTLRDQPSTSQGLTRGRSADASTEFSSSHESRWDPTGPAEPEILRRVPQETPLTARRVPRDGRLGPVCAHYGHG